MLAVLHLITPRPSYPAVYSVRPLSLGTSVQFTYGAASYNIALISLARCLRYAFSIDQICI